MEQSGTRATPRLDLGAAFMEFIVQPGNFIGTRVLPIFNTEKKAANFPAITRESLTRTPDAKRSTRGNYSRIFFETEDKSYACKEFGLEGPLGDDERALYQSDFDAELVTTLGVGRTLQLLQEIRIHDAVFNTSTFSGAALFTDRSGVPWDAVGSDAIGHVRAGKTKVIQNCGLMPTSLIIGHDTLENLKSNTAVKAAIQYIEKLTDENLGNALASLFGLRELIVGRTVKNSAKKGQAFSGAFVWPDDYAMIAVIPSEGQDLTQPALGRTFLWASDSPDNVTVEQYRDDPARSDVFRTRHHVAEKIIDAFFGHLLKVDA